MTVFLLAGHESIGNTAASLSILPFQDLLQSIFSMNVSENLPATAFSLPELKISPHSSHIVAHHKFCELKSLSHNFESLHSTSIFCIRPPSYSFLNNASKCS